MLDRNLRRFAFLLLAVFAFLAAVGNATADEKSARALLEEVILAEDSQKQALFERLAETGEPVVSEILASWRRGEVFVAEGPDGAKIPVVRSGGKLLRIGTGEPVDLPVGKPVDTDRKMRRAMQNVTDLLALADPQSAKRAEAVRKLGLTQKSEYLPILRKRLEVETTPSVQESLKEAIAITELAGSDAGAKVAAVTALGEMHSIASLDTIKKLEADPDPAVAAAAKKSAVKIQNYLSGVEVAGTLFRGISLGSVLLVAALGLAITFGLMGVINMAHGEIIVVGAYTTFLVQGIFGAGLTIPFFGLDLRIPGFGFGGALYESYFLFAIPISFLVAALVGIALERGVIRFLYSRPLESLLATWGVSLVLQQLFRLIFGSNNVQVYSPSWLSGSFTVSDVLLGWNRLFVIGFAAGIVILIWFLLTKTPLGLMIRAVMQDRNMASCMGVRTERVNMMTFGLGSGLAGLAGAFLSQLGNVGPSLGQSYIVDCFMTVVVGGVGNLVGTIYSALGIGIVDQALQPVLGPVMGKITVLAAIILFLQWKPGGLFPTKSRSLEG
jgi:urea transport system permease protein